MKSVLLVILGLVIAFAVDLLIGYLLDSIKLAGIIVIPYVIIVLIYIFDKEENQNDGSTS